MNCMCGATHKLSEEELVCALRSTLDVKGRGEMEVWLVLEAKARARAASLYSSQKKKSGAATRLSTHYSMAS